MCVSVCPCIWVCLFAYVYVFLTECICLSSHLCLCMRVYVYMRLYVECRERALLSKPRSTPAPSYGNTLDMQILCIRVFLSLCLLPPCSLCVCVYVCDCVHGYVILAQSSVLRVWPTPASPRRNILAILSPSYPEGIESKLGVHLTM